MAGGIRTKAMRSRCCGSILACTLQTKPVTCGSSGAIGRSPLVPWAGCGRGGGEFGDAANSQQLAHPELVERTTEIDRRQMARAIGLRVEGRAEALR